MQLFIIALGLSSVLCAEVFPNRVEARYAKYKHDVLHNFVDDHSLVCNRKGSEFVDQGDCGWRTGLFLFCLAVERDDKNCQRFLTSLSKSWRDGKPVRHPSDRWFEHYRNENNLYSRDQFRPQLAAIHYCHKFGDDKTKKATRDLLERFIRLLMDNDWRFNTGQAAELPTTGQFVLREVAKRMDLGNLWEPPEVHESNPLERARKEVQRKLQIEKNNLLYDGYRELWVRNIDLQARRIELGIGLDGNRLPQFNPDAPMEFYAIHNLFWEILLVYDCRSRTANLRDYTKHLSRACERHNMAPLLWLANREERPRGWLLFWTDDEMAWPNNEGEWSRLDWRDWSKLWSHENYVWQRNLAEQRAVPNAHETYPRLDYMVLRRLFDLQVVR
jgi:hypothetical protein